MITLIVVALILLVILAMIFGRLDLLYGIVLIVIIIIVAAVLGGLEINK